MKTIHEKIRGCGYRKKGGIYLFAGGGGSDCGRIPIPLCTCPYCGIGIKFSRGFTWIRWELLAVKPCDKQKQCNHCPLSDARIKTLERVGLMWVGEKFYPSPAHFEKEGNMQGISKRIASVPKDFKLGETWIALAHAKAIKESTVETTTTAAAGLYDFAPECKVKYIPGIFQLFRPSEIQYVCDGNESPDELAALEKRGLTPVKIEYGSMAEQTAFELSNQTN